MSERFSPYVDVVIAAHDPRRTVGRAVSSVLDGVHGEVRVTVVAHHVTVDEIREAVGVASNDPRVRIVPFSDGVRSPAGPFNHGIALSEAEYVSIMGSDDFLEQGAMSAWLRYAFERRLDYLIPLLRNQDGARWRDPLTRSRRREGLDLVRDRLAYRAAPLGLIRRSLLARVDPPLTPGLPSGEDIELGLALAAQPGRIGFGDHLPAYVIGADAPERITLEPRPASAELEALGRLPQWDWFFSLPLSARRAVAIKLWRMNIVPAVISRRNAEWSRADLDALAEVSRNLEEAAPGARSRLSRSEGKVAAASLAPTVDGLRTAVDAAYDARPIDRTLTWSALHVLAVDSPVRRLLRLRAGR